MDTDKEEETKGNFQLGVSIRSSRRIQKASYLCLSVFICGSISLQYSESWEPQMDTDKVTETIIGCAMKVSNTLGVGFLEKVYENALAIELRKAGLVAEQQKPILVRYEGAVVGYYVADIVVNGSILLELKAAKFIDQIHQAQLLNYMKATALKIGLILNFGTTRLGVKRMVL